MAFFKRIPKVFEQISRVFRKPKVILTFDDGSVSHLRVVAPILKEFNFQGTFFVCSELFGKTLGSTTYLEGHQILSLHQQGFEIGNHMAKHVDLTKQDSGYLISKLDEDLQELGIPNTTTFCYPGFHVNEKAKHFVKEEGFKYARSGCEAVLPFEAFQQGGKGCGVNPGDDQFGLNCFAVFGKNYRADHFIRDFKNISDKYLILCFHDVRDRNLRAVDISVQDFRRVLTCIQDQGFKTIQFKDIKL